MIDFSALFDYPIYVVGGAVRDNLLGAKVKDIDLASALRPNEFIERCKTLGYKTYPTGIKHGTVTVRIKGECYEHTTFRFDVSCDGRNATVQYSDTIEEDLSRRDFTMNAIAMLGNDYIDPFDGKKDLFERKVLRTVGVASERFKEDYLRIIRAARFASRLTFDCDQDLINAARELSKEIPKHVSPERITDEFKKAQGHGKAFIEQADHLGFLKYILPEFYGLSLEDRTELLVFVKRSQNCSESFYFASLFCRLGDERKLIELAKRFKLSNSIKDQMIVFKRYSEQILKVSELNARELRSFILLIKKDHLELFKYVSIIINGNKDFLKLDKVNSFYNKVMESIESPLITGKFLLEKGIKPSPEFKRIIEEAGSLQAEGLNIDKILIRLAL